jgi:ketosteroid isomerase-like protein
MSMPAEAAVPHPYRRALEERDIEAFIETLHPDVEFWTPAFERAIRGRDNVLALFAKLGTVFEDPVFTDEMAGDGSHVVVFRLSVKGRPIEGCDYLELDGDGRVRTIKVFMRPLASVEVLAGEMRETHAQLSASTD